MFILFYYYHYFNDTNLIDLLYIDLNIYRVRITFNIKFVSNIY